MKINGNSIQSSQLINLIQLKISINLNQFKTKIKYYYKIKSNTITKLNQLNQINNIDNKFEITILIINLK